MQQVQPGLQTDIVCGLPRAALAGPPDLCGSDSLHALLLLLPYVRAHLEHSKSRNSNSILFRFLSVLTGPQNAGVEGGIQQVPKGETHMKLTFSGF